MPQIMAEAFARGLLDKIMVQVLDVIDCDAEDGKSWEEHVNEETDDVQPEAGFVHGRPEANEHTHVNYSKAEEIELIAKIVRDLRDIQIGDSRYVLPPSLLAVEKQVKCATCNVDGVSFANPAANVTDIQRTTQGQGDTHQTVHTTNPETELTDPTKVIQKKKEGEVANEATSVSIGLLQQMIEDLEDKTVCSEDNSSSNSISKECITVWEEKEELIRSIEGNAGNTMAETLRSSESIGRFRIVELKHDEELKSHSSQHVASISREPDLEEVQIEKRTSNSLSSLKPSYNDGSAIVDQILPIDDAEKRKTFDEAKKRKKSLGSRLRKLFRTVFGRRKN
ncbi:uncharacterized protein LOC105429081 isoform X1 [Pogonomyrmex barbatus]|uniref:Uncharacterized protein LOC105429081 isoform X1 n=1 Tax=Pogonomyrmex barbatus TaxID=144034 RepID=A0A6I9X6M4_9HYME|nr:uncharacterized protein LOC105429081 isoform X1 [Pogonomyrmex barbatus]XP_025074540.1 uncharacterized protein LOC105429081 isoform X1 [Pogonomyrmex barbatus]